MMSKSLVQTGLFGFDKATDQKEEKFWIQNLPSDGLELRTHWAFRLW